MKKKRVAILGSTGSIGDSTLKVVRRYPQYFDVVALSAYNSIRSLEKQIEEFKPKYVAVSTKGLDSFKKKFGDKIIFFNVYQDLVTLLQQDDIDLVVLGMRGAEALKPFLAAVKAGKTVAPANKEALVIAGELIVAEALKNKATIIPVDSEQSAIFQCLRGEKHSEVRKIVLTASGGALREVDENKFDQLTVDDILAHPRWKMGPKITVDSATLMNKGFEVIEAQRLFNLFVDQIEVVVHPEAIVHSMVEFNDGSVMAQLAPTDMQLPIQFAMTYPERLSTNLPSLDLVALSTLRFEKPDIKKFPLLGIAFDVARRGGTFPSVLNAVDEVAVEAFLGGKIPFKKIIYTVESIVRKHKGVLQPNLNDILEADSWAREEAKYFLEN